MGKTPGKWIKNLLGKKSSKSNSLKKREILKPADKGEPLVSINEPLPELPTEIPVSSPPVPDISSRNEVDSEKEIAATLENPEVPLCSAKEGGVAETTVDLATFGDSQKTRHEQAATQAQAAFRGYLARRAFRTLKGIVKLQALIRGHLVRRQAVATFSCVWGIVKLQALARGQKVRCSDIGIEAHKIYSQGKLLDAKYAITSGLSLSTRAQRLRKNAFIQKLLVVSPTAMPLRLQYGPGESNSANEWLERWTMSHFWEPLPQPKKKNDPKSQTKRSGSRTKETDQSRPKRSIRKPSTPNFENGTTNHSASESEKRKRNIVKKLPGHVSNPVQEHPSTEKDKIKRNLRKTSDSTKDVSKKSEVDNGKTKQNPRKAPASSNPEITVHGIVTADFAEKVNDMVVTPKQQSDPETSLNLPAANILVDEIHDQSIEENGKTESIQELHDRSVAHEKPVEENGKSESIQELHDRSVADEKPVEENGTSESIQESDKELNSNDGQINKENPKNSQRRVSLPANTDDQENTLQSTPKLPSYMAPTASAKARLRGQGSPRFSLEVVEKNSATRRLSLPSSNGKLSTPSPQAQKLLQASGKGVVRIDKSLTSSRDGGRSTWN